MRLSIRSLLASIFVASLLFLPVSVRAQDKTEEKPKDPERAFMDALIAQANRDFRDFYQGKGKKDMTKHPGRKWAEVVWQYRAAHPDSPLANEAGREAIFWLMQAGDADGAFTKLASLGPDDPLWPTVLPMLGFFSSDKARDHGIQLMEKLVAQTQRDRTKAVSYFQLAESYRRKDPEKAKSYLRAAIEAAKAAPSARWWEDSESFLYELTNLNVGQTFPHFAAPTTDNKTFNPEDLRGKTVLLNFWATW